MLSFLYFICIRHKWLIYVILWEYAYSIHTIGWIVEDLIPWFAGIYFLLLNPASIFVLTLDLWMTFSFIDYHLYEQNDLEYFVLFSVANLIFWMPIAFAIQMYAIRKYRKRKSIKMVAIAVTVIGLTYIGFIWYPWLS